MEKEREQKVREREREKSAHDTHNITNNSWNIYVKKKEQKKHTFQYE